MLKGFGMGINSELVWSTIERLNVILWPATSFKCLRRRSAFSNSWLYPSADAPRHPSAILFQEIAGIDRNSVWLLTAAKF
jgi:hypothetical protein